MTATATLRRPLWRGPHSPRHGVTKILRGASWKSGWVILAHGLASVNDRLMSVPDGGFNTAVTAANGGPLQVAGADANGGVRVIGKVPGLGYSQTIAGAGAVAVSILYNTLGFAVEVNVSVPAATTAVSVCVALQSSQAADLLDASYSGSGAGVAVTAAVAAVPFVRVYGVARADVDNTSDVVNDNDLLRGTPEEACGDAGLYGLEFTGTAYAPALAYLIDNQTVAFIRGATGLYVQVPCRFIDDGQAFCDLAVGYN